MWPKACTPHICGVHVYIYLPVFVHCILGNLNISHSLFYQPVPIEVDVFSI